jgi:hypothetical protein
VPSGITSPTWLARGCSRFGAAVRVLLTQALRSAGVTNVDAQNAILNEARREVRARAKEALERVLQDLENG